MSKIVDIHAREVLDSRGNPTVEVEVYTEKVMGSAMVPSGASTGSHEALELRDGKARYNGKGVMKAVGNVNVILKRTLKGRDISKLTELDELMIRKDGTQSKSRLGANAILGVSMAACRAAAAERGMPLFEHLNSSARILPVPLMNILNGGVHADSGLEFQELMIVPVGAKNFKEALRMGAETFHALGGILKEMGCKTTVGDEGGYAPNLGSVENALQIILKAVKKAGYREGKDIMLAMDCAATEYYDSKKKKYNLRIKGRKENLKGNEMADYLLELTKKFPIISIEDGLAEDDFESWKYLKLKSKDKIQLVGDDLFVTNTERLALGIMERLANSILIKLNQIGTVSETISAVKMAHENEWTAIISHRSGETEDPFIADLAVAMSTGQIKTGSLSRTDRICKYNQLLRIEERLGQKAIFPGLKAFSGK